MALESASVIILARIVVQTLALSALFIWAGMPLVRRSFRTEVDRPLPLSFVYGGGFFLGLSVFLILFVFLTRAFHGAHLGLWLAIAGLIAIPVAFRARDSAPELWTAHARVIASLLGLAAFMAVTNATCWLLPAGPPGQPSPTPSMMQHFGSIHSGRYANYAIYIADHDRIPRLAQNMGQSMLTAVHLLLGADAPLAALATWVPAALAAFAMLVFGFLRWNGVSPGWALTGAFFVFYCNIAVSLTAVFLLDNGCPLGFAGYTDIITAAATFLLACGWFRLLTLDPAPAKAVLFPFILGIAWCWCAPQNIAILGVAAGATGLLYLWRQREYRVLRLRRFAIAGLAFVAAIAVGRTKLGAMLPPEREENIGATVYVPRAGFRVRPYIQYYWRHWREGQGNLPHDPRGTPETDLYHYTYEEAKPQGQAAVVARFTKLITAHFADSIRIYGFLLLGVGLIALRLRSPADGENTRDGLRFWFWLGLLTFLTGYVVVFTFELAEIKWWLTRFLVPGVVVCLTGLVLALAPTLGQKVSWGRRLGWAVLLFVGVFGPAVEFSELFVRTWVTRGKTDPAAHRLNLLAQTKGPFPH
jgi:hypothetical protein